MPGIQIEWLAQEPVTTVLDARGESIHPASAELASEAAHIDREAGTHDLHAFQALRRLDEIFCANFMVFADLVSEEAFDVWVGDEAWEVDHFLHDNPELKTAPYVWLTDFVGYLPMPAGGEHEAYLTADANAEMIEQVERTPWVRDRAIFVGRPDDIVPGTFGPGLPGIREWSERHYRFAGYVPGFEVDALRGRAALRSELGYGDAPRCLVSVGGSGVGLPLCSGCSRRCRLRVSRCPGSRCSRSRGLGSIRRAFLGRTGSRCRGTCTSSGGTPWRVMSRSCRAGSRRRWSWSLPGGRSCRVPLASHFEQRFHVRHRLDRHGARAWLEYEDAASGGGCWGDCRGVRVGAGVSLGGSGWCRASGRVDRGASLGALRALGSRS